MLNRRQFLEGIVAFSIGVLGYSCKGVTDVVAEPSAGDDTMSPLPEGSDCSFCYGSIHNHDDPEPVVGMVNQEVSLVEGYIQNLQELNEDGIPVSLEGYVTRCAITEGDDFGERLFSPRSNEFLVLALSDSYIIHQKGVKHYFEIDLREIDPPLEDDENEIPQHLYDLGREIAGEFLEAFGTDDIIYSRMNEN